MNYFIVSQYVTNTWEHTYMQDCPQKKLVHFIFPIHAVLPPRAGRNNGEPYQRCPGTHSKCSRPCLGQGQGRTAICSGAACLCIGILRRKPMWSWGEHANSTKKRIVHQEAWGEHAPVQSSRVAHCATVPRYGKSIISLYTSCHCDKESRLTMTVTVHPQ